ncbi:chymotrypsin inhibitor Ani s 6-like [Prorops nasuta]|uniref:chymotrypsin inhibitor Ani s 6-like n=1 Tax=Prorops nasuta TaxID=863751 RepID=UPI0034CFDC95
MFRNLILVFAVVTLLSTVAFAQQTTCDGDNEVFSDCTNACFDRCSSINPGTACPLYCVEGCKCITGYKYNSDGDCIPEREC